MGFLGFVKNLAGAAVGFAVGGPAGAAAGYKVASMIGSSRPPDLYPTPSLPPVAQLPYFSYEGGGAGSGPVNTYQPPKTTPSLGGVRAQGITSATKGSPRKTAAKRAAKRKPAKKRAKARKLKFGSPAWRKKYMKAA